MGRFLRYRSCATHNLGLLQEYTWPASRVLLGCFKSTLGLLQEYSWAASRVRPYISVLISYITVNAFATLINSIIIFEKANGQMRLCNDPKDLNREIKREHFNIATQEEILGKLANAKWFSKVDATAGFHQTGLDKKIINAHHVQYSFREIPHLRLPMGICSAPEVFHNTLCQFLEDLDGVSVYVDNIIVWGSTEAEQDERLEKTVHILTDVGLA